MAVDICTFDFTGKRPSRSGTCTDHCSPTQVCEGRCNYPKSLLQPLAWRSIQRLVYSTLFCPQLHHLGTRSGCSRHMKFLTQDVVAAEHKH